MRRSDTDATLAEHSMQLRNDYCKLCSRAPTHSVRVREPYAVPCYFRNASLRPLLGRTHISTRDMHGQAYSLAGVHLIATKKVTASICRWLLKPTGTLYVRG